LLATKEHDMIRRSLPRLILPTFAAAPAATIVALVFVFVVAVAPAPAANIKNFIEAARHTPVVYVGIVRDVKQLSRDKFAITAQARVQLKVVGRGGDAPAVGGFRYLTFDDEMLPMDGPPEYVLRPGMWVLVFADTFDSSYAPNYLRNGDRAELQGLIEKFADSAVAMTAENLAFNEITATQRDEQVALYRRLLEQLKALP
jgi:hypothetical protein